MRDDEPFLRAIVADPDDAAVRLVYADWLEERGDARGEYLRLGVRLGDDLAARRRMVELRPTLPPAWLALLGDFRSCEMDPDDTSAVQEAAGRLGRPSQDVDGGYDRHLVAAAVQPFTDAVAYVECRSEWFDSGQDIAYHLHLREADGRESVLEVQTYNPFFGCDVRFLEWYGPVVVMIYREKHRTFASRFRFDAPAAYVAIEDEWVIDGPQLGYWGYQETTVRRLSVPGLGELPPLSADEAEAWGVLPARFW